MTYKIPALTRSEVPARGWHLPRVADCPRCQSGTPVGHWPSTACRSSFRRGDDGIERLFRVHCTCDHCF